MAAFTHFSLLLNLIAETSLNEVLQEVAVLVCANIPCKILRNKTEIWQQSMSDEVDVSTKAHVKIE